MIEDEMAKKLTDRRLTIDQIYQEFPFVKIDIIDHAIEKLMKVKSYNCMFADGYFYIQHHRAK